MSGGHPWGDPAGNDDPARNPPAEPAAVRDAWNRQADKTGHGRELADPPRACD